MTRLEIHKYAPSPQLLHCIDAYWSIANVCNERVDIPVVPDGCMDIICKNGVWMLVGVMDAALVVPSHPGDATFGIRFKAGVLPPLLGIDAAALTNIAVPLQEVSPHFHTLLDGKSTNPVAHLEAFNAIFEAACASAILEPVVRKAVAQIVTCKGDTAIDHIAQTLHVSMRQLQRLFGRHVGVSPKKFANIVRFFHMFKTLIKTGTGDLAQKAYELGYCDQAHFNREFKKFSGLTPNDTMMSLFYKTKP